MCVAIYLPTKYSPTQPRAGFLLKQCYDCFISTYPISEEQLKAFLEKVKGDTSLQEKCKGAADSDAVVAIAKEASFIISAKDINKAQSDLSEEELEGVAGGASKTMADSLKSRDWNV